MTLRTTSEIVWQISHKGIRVLTMLPSKPTSKRNENVRVCREYGLGDAVQAGQQIRDLESNCPGVNSHSAHLLSVLTLGKFIHLLYASLS